MAPHQSAPVENGNGAIGPQIERPERKLDVRTSSLCEPAMGSYKSLLLSYICLISHIFYNIVLRSPRSQPLPFKPRPIRVPRDFQPPKPVQTRFLAPETSNVHIVASLSRQATLLRPRLLHILPLLTLRFPLQDSDFLKIHVGAVKSWVVTAVLRAFSFEEFGKVAGLDLFFVGQHRGQGSGEGCLGRVG